MENKIRWELAVFGGSGSSSAAASQFPNVNYKSNCHVQSQFYRSYFLWCFCVLGSVTKSWLGVNVVLTPPPPAPIICGPIFKCTLFRLGYSEVELVQCMIDGVNTLVKEDVELQKKHGL